MTRDELIRKYDVPVPRYTSYPTVPCWEGATFDSEVWRESVARCAGETNQKKGISLYVHLPYCESLCTYCACNTRITRNHGVEGKYIDAVLHEWSLYRSGFSELPVLREIHLGGGTPTFFSPANLSRLIIGLLKGCVVHPLHEFSFEGHPNNTTADHLSALYDLGFERVSFGVQDLDLKVQTAINRIQPFAKLREVTSTARAKGYKSVSFDLIYGLPYQTLATISETIDKVISLRPDRIAFYSYAHVPWLKPGQRGYEDADLPSDVLKRALYEEGRGRFLAAGYIDIGMDHFSLPEDSLAVAFRENRLHRNFMGYTTNQTDLLIGLGTSAIGDSAYAYAQNEKKVEDYLARLAHNELPVFKGHVQTEEDARLRKLILGIVCNSYVNLREYSDLVTKDMFSSLQEMKSEGILDFSLNEVRVTGEGRPFIRNIAAIFDKRMKEKGRVSSPLFSKAI
jgi:oxygen-independent coproporphyrinogen III oxidase